MSTSQDTTSTPPDQLLHARWVLPIAPANRVLDEHCVALHQDRIVAVLPSSEARRQWPQARQVELSQHALMPGLVNAHGHAAMSLFRGYGDDLPLATWLNERIWPLEGRWVDADFVGDGALLACAEMIASGTTTFSDMYFFPEVTAAVAQRSGLRAQLCAPIVQMPNPWSNNADAALHQALELHDAFRDEARISIAFGPHSTYALDTASLQRVGTLADELDLNVQIHLHETAAEVADALDQHGERPIDTVFRCGLFGPGLQAVHMTQLQRGDIDRLAQHGVSVIHCPRSNLKLASGFCPVAQLQEAGVRVALGTDGAASNNGLSMFRELQSAALLAKAVSGDAAALPALDALAMATLRGAEALGLDTETGSLEPGKAADLVAVNLERLGCAPVYHPESQLVYADAEHGVSHVWAAGRPLLEDGRLLTLDADQLLQLAERWRQRIMETGQ